MEDSVQQESSDVVQTYPDIPEELKEPSKIIEFLRKLVNGGGDLWWMGVNGGKKAVSAASEGFSGLLAYRRQRIEAQRETLGSVYYQLTQSSSKILWK